MMTRTTDCTWLFIANGDRGTLWRGRKAPNGHRRLERVDAVENRWEEHQHGRPSPLKGKDAHTHAAPRREAENRLHHFAKDLVTWLETRIGTHAIDGVHLFAPPRLLGELRRCRPDRLAARMKEHDADLGSLPADDLLRHPVVADLIQFTATT